MYKHVDGRWVVKHFCDVCRAFEENVGVARLVALREGTDRAAHVGKLGVELFVAAAGLVLRIIEEAQCVGASVVHVGR